MKTIDTFYEMDDYSLNKLIVENPSVGNFDVHINKFKITVELIEEPKEVIEERLQKLWDDCKNHHHKALLLKKAKEINYQFKS